MRWEIEWMPACRRDVQRLHWQVAERICARVVVAAEDRDGSLAERDARHCIDVPGAMAIVYRNDETRTLEVQRIHRTRR